MKILLITQDAPLYLAGFLDRLLPAISAAGHEVALTRLSPRFRRTWTAEIRDRLAFRPSVGRSDALPERRGSGRPSSGRKGDRVDRQHASRGAARRPGHKAP